MSLKKESAVAAVDKLLSSVSLTEEKGGGEIKEAAAVAFVYFKRDAEKPLCFLSNFARVRPDEVLEFRGLVYPSAEHAWQSLKVIPEDRIRFAVDGDLSSLQSIVNQPHLFPELKTEEERLKKLQYYSSKEAVGIVAKMATTEGQASKSKNPEANRKTRKRENLGLRLTEPVFQPNKRDFMEILWEKFKIPRFRDLLLGTPNIQIASPLKKNPHFAKAYTGAEVLVERINSAKQQVEKGERVFYGGFVDPDTGVLFGDNKMGQWLMQIRDMIQNDQPFDPLLFAPLPEP